MPKSRRRQSSPAATRSSGACSRRVRRVALLGSSGGSTHRCSALEEFECLSAQLSQLPDVCVEAMAFVESTVPLDHAAESAPAALWTLGSGAAVPARHAVGTLAEVNHAARKLDAEIAVQIRRGGIDALVLVSAHFAEGDGVNISALRAAVETRTPCLGTGGVCLGMAVDAGAELVQQSGSVSTNANSRAIASAAALARRWKLRFEPKLPPPDCAVLPILDAVLPIILSLALMHAARRAVGGGEGTQAAWTQLLTSASTLGVPTSLAALAGRRAAQLGESGTLAGLLAGGLASSAAAAPPLLPLAGLRFSPFKDPLVADWPSSSSSSTAAAALIAGLSAGLLSRRALAATHTVGLAATASTLITVGGSGMAGGFIGALAAPLTSAATVAARAVLSAPARAAYLPLVARLAAGGVLGVLTKWGSIRGYYHCVHFPLILIEMHEGRTFSLLGALDACCLCCVCAGVCAAVALTSPAAAEAAASRRALAINLGLGDFVEACYPHMEKSQRIRLAAYAGAALAGAVLFGVGDQDGAPPRSSAYLPMPLAVAVSDQPSALALAGSLAFMVPFVGCLMISTR